MSKENKGYVTVKKNMDCMHRVMHHSSCCKSCHGHTYNYELTFEFDQLLELGYSIDFSELKRVGVQWIEDSLDHGAVLNPHDTVMRKACEELNSKIWLMSLNGEGEFCNPSVENIAKEVFLAMEILFETNEYIRPHQIRIYETPNCYTDVFANTATVTERANFNDRNYDNIASYRDAKGVVEYDDRKV